MLAGIRGDWGTEDRVRLLALRHHVIGARSLGPGGLVGGRRGGFRGLRCLDALRLLALGLPLLL